MSTYNGEKYLREQLDSIVSQRDVQLQLVVRDDGSTDCTLQILSEYAQRGLLTYYGDGENLGPQRSFMRLLAQAPQADYYAFSDQDDYWLPEKLSTAVQMLQADGDSLGLYFCQTKLVDKDLHPLPQIPIHPLCTYGESLIYKFVGGCTMVLTHSLRMAIGSYVPPVLTMHDRWIYCVALAVGAQVHFDPIPHMLYRQHGNNAVGQGHTLFHELRDRWKRFTSRDHERWQEAHDLLEAYGPQMPAENLRLTQLFLRGRHSGLTRLRMLGNRQLRCASRTTQWLFWINVLCNNY